MTAVETTTIADFFDEDLAPLVRRMADRPRAEGGDSDHDSREIRAMVWQGLAGLGALDAAGTTAGTTADAAADTVRLAELLGSVLYQGPLLDTLTALELFGNDDIGQAPVALAVAAEPWSSGQDGAISARRAFVGFAAEVDYFVVGGADTGGPRLALVRAGHPSITMRRYEETSRGEAYEVEFADTPVAAWAATGWQAALANARVRQAAYLVGLAQAALDHAVVTPRRAASSASPSASSRAWRSGSASCRCTSTRHACWSTTATRPRTRRPTSRRPRIWPAPSRADHAGQRCRGHAVRQRRPAVLPGGRRSNRCGSARRSCDRRRGERPAEHGRTVRKRLYGPGVSR